MFFVRGDPEDNHIICELLDGSKIYASTLVQDMVMDQSFAGRNISSIQQALHEMFEDDFL